MTGIHGISAPIAMLGLGTLSVTAAVLALLRREPKLLEWVRRAALVVIVAEAAFGLALAARGAAPTEWIHWLYGFLVGVILLLPSTLGDDASPRARTGAVAICAGIAATLTWRLWSSG